ncbi:MAG: 16S rRNA (adenine(1518)-N(6)/adenine(1519)-N(6))-dimethyltransferase RsmA [Nitrososphaerota archaeon]
MRGLSQHFTVSRGLLERIVELADPAPSDIVVEPGCGDGRLTHLLAEKGCKVIAIEIDPELAAIAKQRLQGKDNVEVIVGDILRVNSIGFTMVVGNPPYHISRRLIEWIIANPQARLVVLTLQKEFAHKLSAPPGSRNYLYISLVSQMLYSIEIHDTVPPSAFSPRPRVTSCIVKMQRNLQKPLSHAQLTLLKYIFTDRRHVLGKVLRRMGYEAPQQLANKRISDLTIHEALKLVESLAE